MEPRGLVSVRLTEEETKALDLLAISWGLATRSDVIRALIERSKDLPSPDEEHIQLPPILLGRLEKLVEVGWAHTLSQATAMASDRGIRALIEDHGAQDRQLEELAQLSHQRRVAHKSLAPSANRGPKR